MCREQWGWRRAGMPVGGEGVLSLCPEKGGGGKGVVGPVPLLASLGLKLLPGSISDLLEQGEREQPSEAAVLGAGEAKGCGKDPAVSSGLGAGRGSIASGHGGEGTGVFCVCGLHLLLFSRGFACLERRENSSSRRTGHSETIIAGGVVWVRPEPSSPRGRYGGTSPSSPPGRVVALLSVAPEGRTRQPLACLCMGRNQTQTPLNSH